MQLPETTTGLLIELTTPQGKLVLHGLATTALPYRDLAACHRSVPTHLHAGHCPPSEPGWAALQQYRLGQALAEPGGAYARAMALRSLPILAEALLVVADPALPLMRARARALAYASGMDVLVANAEITCLVPRTGRLQTLPIGAVQILLALPTHYTAIVLSAVDATGNACRAVAEALQIPVIDHPDLPIPQSRHRKSRLKKTREQ